MAGFTLLVRGQERQVRHFIIEPEVMHSLQRVMLALYDDKPMSGDRRRDLANTLDALLDNAIPELEDESCDV